MKARAVKPVFWKDAEVSHWPDALRLFYVGTWMLADDAGYIRSDPVGMAADLYPYQSVKARERAVVGHLQRLQDAGKLEMLPCGRHGVVASVREHPMGGVKSDHIQREHQHRCHAGNGKS